MEKKFTPDNIQELKENQIFVFGSNMNGNHAGGAARLAVERFGAIMGRAEGIQGQSYAIPTLDEDMEKVTEEDLINYLGNLRHFANEHPEKEFLLTAIGTGIAGFDTNYMAYMVLRANLPGNVTIPEEFSKIKGFKGFNSDMTCRDFKYDEGKDYKEQGDISVCSNRGAASATGKESIALAAGKDCKAKGALGCWIVLAERGEWDGNTYPIVSVKAFKVDGKSIKEDTFYTLVNGEAVEAD